MAKGSRGTRLDLTREQALFVQKAVESQLEQLKGTDDWPAIIPYSKEYVVDSHQGILDVVKNVLADKAPATRAPRKPRVAKESTNGVAASA